MVSGCTGFTLEMFMQGNGLMGRVMGVESIPVRMGVDMLGSSSGVSSMALVTTISVRNGDTYAGEYFADKMHGFGVYRFANGHRYEGAWHEGRRQGLGMYTFRNGETQAGHWQNGVLDVPSTRNATSPVSPIAVNHSKVLYVVQEMRIVSEKAYDVAKVDERVNRAVTAANRAANAARVSAVKAVQKQMQHNTSSDHMPIQIV